MSSLLKANVLASFLLASAAAQIEIVPLRTDTPPVLDGVIDEVVWRQARAYSAFETVEPDYGKTPSERTTTRVAYDDEYLYFAIEAFDTEPDRVKATVTKWDNLFQDDWVGVGIDALNDQQTAYGFVVNAFGSQGDVIMVSNGDPDPSEDFIWDAAGSLNHAGYSVELRIPLQSIRFDAGDHVTMGIFFVRNLNRQSERVIFPPTYPDRGAFLSQLAPAVFRDLAYRRTYEILPSYTQSAAWEARAGELVSLPEDTRSFPLVTAPGALGTALNRPGVTAKVGLTSTLTLDLTVNPDFSQVESDAGQVDVNLRSELFFPEKRPFFLEGIRGFDLAGLSGGSAISRVVHTRTIAEPTVGLKLTGKLGRSHALAAVLARDAAPGILDETGEQAGFGILRYKRLLRDESYLGAMLISRGYLAGTNRLTGVDGVWRLSGKTRLEGNALLGFSRPEEGGAVTRSHNADLSWVFGDRNYLARLGLHDISRDFRLDAGFVPRDGVGGLSFTGDRILYPQSKLVPKVTLGYRGFLRKDKYSDLYDWRNMLRVNVVLPRSAYFEAHYHYETEVYAGEAFDRSGPMAFLGGQVFKWLFVNFSLIATGTPLYELEPAAQGDRIEQSAFLNFQPTENFSTELYVLRQLLTRRSAGEVESDFRLYRSKTTYQLSKYLFVRGILEYNAFREHLTAEFLASFTYVPGTVLHLGYGSRFDQARYDGSEYVPAAQLLEATRGLFFKASYNLRL